MKKILIILFLINYYFSTSFGQIDLNFESKKILTTGIKLYKLEKAAWVSTDSLQTEIKEMNFTGYVSYFKDDTLKVIYYKKIDEKEFQILYTFDFDTTINVNYLNHYLHKTYKIFS